MVSLKSFSNLEPISLLAAPSVCSFQLLAWISLVDQRLAEVCASKVTDQYGAAYLIGLIITISPLPSETLLMLLLHKVEIVAFFLFQLLCYPFLKFSEIVFHATALSSFYFPHVIINLEHQWNVSNILLEMGSKTWRWLGETSVCHT